MVAKLQSGNIDMFLKDGPRIRYSYNLFVVARDDEARMVLIGGLGSLGIGRAWRYITDDNRRYPGFEDAPQMKFEERKSRG